MKKIICLLLAIVSMATMAFSQDAKKKVAVYVTGEVESGYKKVIGSKMVSGITKSEGYIAVERTSDFLAALSKEQDYQTSGAVNDNQIVKLGQQFGVRYVVVVDVSEVFDSMFISARMIDVQTGQISGSAESSKSVDNLEGLMGLSESVASELLGGVAYSDYTTENNVSDIKVIGPFVTEKDLYYHYEKIPEGYHAVSEEEFLALVEGYTQAKKYISYPVYVNVKCYVSNPVYNLKNCSARLYSGANTSSAFSGSIYHPSTWSDGDENNGSITPGYIYLIKNK